MVFLVLFSGTRPILFSQGVSVYEVYGASSIRTGPSCTDSTASSAYNTAPS